MTDLISGAEVTAGKLPAAATGVYWRQTGWLECAATLRDPAWTPGPLQDPDLRDGMIRTAPGDGCDCHMSDARRIAEIRAGIGSGG